MIRTYTEMISLPTFKERYKYLQLNGGVSEETFGFDRYINQQFYKSQQWKKLRNDIIIRDNGCDLADPDRIINKTIIIHHMNPVSKRDILDQTEWLLNPDFLVCVSLRTHNAIHYGDESLLFTELVERTANDTCPWR